eukprot:TRINITY_DN123249_c0_g1_i1.p2 TRINITY_DN123249_c0_g1~~TRINITY_DN123249_c0_g1_i1.p2  ORF type:complete len:161 (-),score=52.40 TRINITY_DN123249_c0_g1_i1:71-553(-)
MWRPDAGPCVAEVAEWGTHPDDVEYERKLRSIPKKILKRRQITVKNILLEKVKAKQGPTKFSVACWPLSQYSKSSGSGEDAASIIQVFYENKDERKVMQCFSSCGIDLATAEAEPVDPKSPLQHEQEIMYMPQCLFLTDTGVHEESPGLSLEEIKQKLGA